MMSRRLMRTTTMFSYTTQIVVSSSVTAPKKRSPHRWARRVWRAEDASKTTKTERRQFAADKFRLGEDEQLQHGVP